MQKALQESIALRETILQDKDLLATAKSMAERLAAALRSGHKLLIAGNGGSAADAQHFAAELVGRCLKERRGYPAIALTADPSIVTAISNDYSFEALFSREVEALGVSGDVFVAISTSGNSKNLIAALAMARQQGLTTLGFLGRDGGEMKSRCDLAFIVPSQSTARIQEIHITLIHAICDALDQQLI